MTKEEMDVLMEENFKSGRKLREDLQKRNFGIQTSLLRMCSCLETRNYDVFFDIVTKIILRTQISIPESFFTSYPDKEKFAIASRALLAGMICKDDEEIE